MLRRAAGKPLGENYPEVMAAAFSGPTGSTQRRRFFEGLCAGKIPGSSHFLLALLANSGASSVLLTTNFDHLSETAYAHYTTRLLRIFLSGDDLDQVHLHDGNPKIVKLHGDFLFDDLANLEHEMRLRVNENMRSKLLAALTNRGLLVLGYGGRDTSIMSLLEYCLKTKGVLRLGIWWVAVSSEEFNNPLVKTLQQIASDNRKPFHFLISPKGAAHFLSRCCRKLDIGIMRRPRFGAGRQSNITLSNLGRFQLRPTPRPTIHHVKHSAVENSRRAALLRSKESTWITDDNTIVLVRSILERQHRRPIFYFSFRFARNFPVTEHLIDSVLTFAATLGVFRPGDSLVGVLEQLLLLNTIFIFDDVPSRNGSAWTHHFLDLVKSAVTAQGRTRKGTVIVLSPPCGSPESLQDTLGCVDAKFPQGNRNLQLMAKLRFAEEGTLLCALFDGPGAQFLEFACQCGIIDQRGNRFCIKEKYREYFAAQEVPLSELARAAAILDVQSDDTSLFGGGIHFHLEAARLYFAAAEYAKAAKIDAPICWFLVHAYGMQFAKAAYSDLREYFIPWRERREQLLRSLSRIDFLQLWRALVDTAIRLRVVDPDLNVELSQVRRDIKEMWPDAWLHAHDGVTSIAKGDPSGGITSLRNASTVLSKEHDFRGLAYIQFELTEHLMDRAEATSNLKDLRAALRCARKSERLFASLGDSLMSDLCKENQSGCLLKLERAHEAEKVLKKFVSDPGLSRRKAVVYGNLFTCNLLLNRHDVAEGYFFESNLNAAYVGYWDGVLRNVLALAEYVAGPSARLMKDCPALADVYDRACSVWSFRPTEWGSMGISKLLARFTRKEIASTYPTASVTKLLTTFLSATKSRLDPWKRVTSAFFVSCLLRFHVKSTKLERLWRAVKPLLSVEEQRWLYCGISWLSSDQREDLRTFAIRHGLPDDIRQLFADMVKTAHSL